MPSEIEYKFIGDYIEELSKTENPSSADKTLVSNETDGPRYVPANPEALTNVATEADMTADAKLRIMTPAGEKQLPANLVAKASEQAALTTYAQNVAHSIAPEFDPTRDAEHPYLVGEVVIEGGKLYECVINHSGPWVAAHFARTNAASGIDYCKANIDGGYYTDKVYTASQISEGIIVDGTDFVYRDVNYFNANENSIKVLYKNSNGDLIGQVDNIARGESGYFEIVASNPSTAKAFFYKAGSGTMLTALELVKNTDGVMAEVERLNEELNELEASSANEFAVIKPSLANVDAKVDGGYYTDKVYTASQISEGIIVDGTDFVYRDVNYFNANENSIKVLYKNSNGDLIGQVDNIARGESGYFEIVASNPSTAKAFFYKAGSGTMLTALELVKNTDGVMAEVERLNEELNELEASSANEFAVIKPSLANVDAKVDGGYYTDKVYTASQISEGIIVDGTDFVYRDVNYFNANENSIKVLYKNSNGDLIGQVDNIARGESGYFEIVASNPSTAKAFFYKAGTGTKLTALELVKNTDGVMAEVERLNEELSFYKKEFIGEVLHLGEGDCFEQCVFKTCSIYLNNGVVLKNCDFVNTILLQDAYTLSNVIVENCTFIGRNSRIQGNCMESFEIVGNEFPPSSERYPDAVPKTKGEFSRNILARTINNCRIERNHIYIGRTGICILGDNNTRNNSCNCSSRYNVIANNIIEGIGEEHISFDGGAYNDGASIVGVESVTFEWKSTGQMQDNGGEDSDQTKLVACVTLELESCVDVKNAKQYSNFNGIHIIALKNSLHYELETFELVGSTLVDDEDGLTYSADGRYKVSFLVPTRYNYKDTVLQADKDAIEQKIRLDFAINDIVSIAAIQSDNVITGNVINGIGTDRSSDIEDMGGIVLYGMCFSNVITNNVLRQKRIWLESFNRKRNVKMSSNNVIANNTLDETCISLLTWITNPLLTSDAKLMQGNTICNNVVAGSFGVAAVDIRNTLNTTLIGNSSKTWSLINNDGLKLVANRTVEPVILSNNTNVTSDSTDELQIE